MLLSQGSEKGKEYLKIQNLLENYNYLPDPENVKNKTNCNKQKTNCETICSVHFDLRCSKMELKLTSETKFSIHYLIKNNITKI